MFSYFWGVAGVGIPLLYIRLTYGTAVENWKFSSGREMQELPGLYRFVSYHPVYTMR